MPSSLGAVRGKLLGLTVLAERLADVRRRRLPDVRRRRLPASRYADIDHCCSELAAAERLMRREGIRCLEATSASVEELAGAILAARGLAP